MTLPPPLTTVFTTRTSPCPSACAPVAVVSTRAAAPPAAAQALLPLMVLPLSCACQERLCDHEASTVFDFLAGPARRNVSRSGRGCGDLLSRRGEAAHPWQGRTAS